MALTPTNRAPTGGTVASAPTLPLASEPPDPTKALVNKPTIQPLGAAPAAPSTPALPLAPQAGGDVGGAQMKGSDGSPGGAPIKPTAQQGQAPSPYQTNDPLAFMPAPAGSTVTETAQSLTPSGTMPAPAPPVTEGSGFLPPDVASAVGGTPAAPQAPIPTTGGHPSYGLTPTTPEGSLVNSTITPGAGVDRYAIANDLLSQWDANEQPQFDARIKSLSQNAAGAGQIGSGMVRGSFRDALNDEQTRRTTAQRGFLDNALNGSIDDAYKNVGIAQQEQQFQAGQAQQGFSNNVTLQQLTDSEQGQQWQQQMSALGFNAQQMQSAFENAYKAQQLSDDETGQAFNRAMQEAIFGAQGNPSDIEEWLAGLYALPTRTA